MKAYAFMCARPTVGVPSQVMHRIAFDTKLREKLHGICSRFVLVT